MVGERKLYNTMRACHISTLDVHRILEEIGISISKRTLQFHLDSGMKTCNDDRIQQVINTMIVDHKKLLTKLKKAFKKK